MQKQLKKQIYCRIQQIMRQIFVNLICLFDFKSLYFSSFIYINFLLYFFLIVFCLTKLINLREHLFFDFNNKRVDVKDAIKTHYIIIVEQRRLINNNKRFKKR